METIKKPETIISLLNTTALLGVSVYFYRKINALELEVDKNNEHLASTIKKVKEIHVAKDHITQLAGAIKQLNTIITTQRNELQNIRNYSAYQRDQIRELQEQTKELGGDPKLTQSPQPLQQQSVSLGQNQGINNFVNAVRQVSTKPQQGQGQGYQQNQPGNIPVQNPMLIPQSYLQSTPVPSQGQGYFQGNNYQGYQNQGYPPGQAQNQGYQTQYQGQGQNQGQGFQAPMNGGNSILDFDLQQPQDSADDMELEHAINQVQAAKQNNNLLGLNL